MYQETQPNHTLLFCPLNEKTISQKILCPSGNQALNLCCSSFCDLKPGICLHQSCKCNEEHAMCTFIKTKNLMKKFVQKVNNPPKHVLQTCNKVEKIYDEMLQQISLQKQNMYQTLALFNLKQNQQLLYNMVIKDQLGKLQSKLLSKISKQMIQSQKYNFCFQCYNFQELEAFWNKQKLFFQKLIQEIRIFRTKDYPWRLKIDSKIIRPGFQLNLINKYIDQNMQANAKKVKAYKKLYRAQQQNFQVKKFHQKCDNIKNTLTLVRTEADKIIGGFTPVPWQSPLNWKRIADQGTFIFSLSLRQKYKFISGQGAVCHNKIYGPFFGAQGMNYDFAISDNASQYATSYFQFPKCFNSVPPKQNSDQTRIQFIGKRVTQIRLKQWEVFEVQFFE